MALTGMEGEVISRWTPCVLVVLVVSVLPTTVEAQQYAIRSCGGAKSPASLDQLERLGPAEVTRYCAVINDAGSTWPVCRSTLGEATAARRADLDRYTRWYFALPESWRGDPPPVAGEVYAMMKCRRSPAAPRVPSSYESALRRVARHMETRMEVFALLKDGLPGATLFGYGASYKLVMEAHRDLQQVMERVHAGGELVLSRFEDALNNLDTKMADLETAYSNIPPEAWERPDSRSAENVPPARDPAPRDPETEARVQQLRTLRIPDQDILKVGCAYWREKIDETRRIAAELERNARAVGSGFTYARQARVARETVKAYERTYERCLVISR